MNEYDISVKRFDEFASEFTERFMNIDSYSVHFEKFAELTTVAHPRILELGCGPGNVTRFLKQKFKDPKIIAVDLAPRMIEIAKQMVSDVDFRVIDVRNINMLNLQFDSIMCAFCLPFLSKFDTDKLFSDCSKLLNTNGLIYISTMEGDESMAGFESTSFSGDAKIYFNYHSKQDLIDSLDKNGFLLEYCDYQNYNNPDGSILTDLILIARKKEKKSY